MPLEADARAFCGTASRALVFVGAFPFRPKVEALGAPPHRRPERHPPLPRWSGPTARDVAVPLALRYPLAPPASPGCGRGASLGDASRRSYVGRLADCAPARVPRGSLLRPPLGGRGLRELEDETTAPLCEYPGAVIQRAE